jgi:hypothetical protein
MAAALSRPQPDTYRRVISGIRQGQVRNAQAGSAFPAAIENQQLMSDQRGFSNHGTEPTGSRKSNDGDNHMKKKSEDVMHGGMVPNRKSPAIQGNWGIRQLPEQSNVRDARSALLKSKRFCG